MSLLFAFNALAPLLALAALGYFLRRRGIFDEVFIGYLNRYIFLVALPVLIFQTLSRINDVSMINWGVVWYATVMINVIAILGYLILLIIPEKRRIKPVLMQSFYRGNFIIIGIPLAIRLGGIEALSMIVVLNAVLYPLTNLYSIITFQLWRSDEIESTGFTRDLINSTIKNPLIISFLLGVIVFFFQTEWLWVTTNLAFIPDTMSLIAVTATPMAMIAIGGQFKLEQAKELRSSILIGVFGRLIVTPLLVFSVALLLNDWIGFEDNWAPMFAIFATPVAVASVAITKGLNGDDEFASQLVIWTTALAVFTIFIFVVIFRTFGLL